MIGRMEVDVLVIHVSADVHCAPSVKCMANTHRQGTNDDIVIHDTTISGITSRVPQAKVVSVIGAEHDLLVVSPYKEKVLQELIAFLK